VDLDFTEEQELLRDTVRELCAKHSSVDIVRALEDDPTGFRRELWDELAKTGLIGLTVAEEHGGAGLGPLELAIVYEELGRAIAPTPHLVSAVVSAGILAAGGTDEQKAAWLPKIASGESIVTLAWHEPESSSGPVGINLRADGDSLTGTKILVPYASSAERLLVLARSSDGIGVWLVDPSSPGVTLTQTFSMGSEADYQVELSSAPGERLPGDGWAHLESALDDGLIAIASAAIGGAERAHEMSVEYAKERVQFDRPIGSFQAIAHPLADIATEVEGGRVLVYEAAWRRSMGIAMGPLAAMAKLYACDVFRRATKVGQQVFGGIGFTRDIDMQLYFRRAKQLEITWFEPRYLEELVARAELDADTPFVGIDSATP
jgi:alkylation response protein AidB-like acyl-CoA dehydrogenase